MSAFSLLPTPRQPTLHIHRPTAATAQYTVTTSPARPTLTSQLLFGLSILARLVSACAIIAVVGVKWRWFGGQQGAREDGPLRLEGRAASPWEYGGGVDSVVGVVVLVAGVVSWKVLLPGAVVGLWACARRGYTEESLLVLRGLGIQTSTSSPSYLYSATTRFIPTTQIQDIFIYEAFKGFEVRFYLAIVVEGEKEVVVVFPRLLPRRLILEEVWRGAKACLYEPKS